MDAVEVRRSPRARRWRLEVPWGQPARLTVPRWMSRAQVERLLAQKRPWLEEQRRRQVPRLVTRARTRAAGIASPHREGSGLLASLNRPRGSVKSGYFVREPRGPQLTEARIVREGVRP